MNKKTMKPFKSKQNILNQTNIKIKVIETSKGTIETQNFINTLSKHDQTLIRQALKKIESLNFKNTKIKLSKLCNKNWEIIITGKTEGYDFLFRYLLNKEYNLTI